MIISDLKIIGQLKFFNTENLGNIADMQWLDRKRLVITGSNKLDVYYSPFTLELAVLVIDIASLPWSPMLDSERYEVYASLPEIVQKH